MERGAAMDIRYHNCSAILLADIILWDLKHGVLVDRLEEEFSTSDTTIQLFCTSMEHH